MCCPSLHTEESTLQRDPGNSGERRGTACNTLCDGSGQMTRKARAKSVFRANPEESSDGEEISIDGCASVQEHSEPVKPAREHI